MIEASVLDVRPHPCQATSNPGCWAVQFSVTHKGRSRAFWRWHNVQIVAKHGVYQRPSNDRPSHDEILAIFWGNEFLDMHGFDFLSGLSPASEAP